MRLLLILVLVVILESMKFTPLCYKGLIFERGRKPYNLSVPQDEFSYACYFEIHYAFQNFSACQFKKLSIRTDYETGSSASANGMCSFERDFWNNRHLKCVCSWDECNSHLENIRPIFDELREDLRNKPEETTIKGKLLDCLEEHLINLRLLPPRINPSPMAQEEPFLESHWLIWLSIVGLGLCLFAIFLCTWMRCNRSKKEQPSGCWTKTTTRGTYVAVPVKEKFDFLDDRPRTL